MSRISLQALLDRSNKNMASGTHPIVRESALEMIRIAYHEGINVQISEGYRSYARQNSLYAQGRTKSGNIVTNARGGFSWHNFGIAIDFFLTNESGSKAIWTVNAKWRRVAQIGKSLGFEWGGDWSGFVDYPHLQMRGGLTMAQMRAGRKPVLVSRVKNPIKPSSKPNSSKPSPTKWTIVKGNWTGQVLREGQYGTPVLQLQQMLAYNHYYPDKGATVDGVDGYFGPKTTDAVKRYQGMYGLTVDGVPGKSTYDSLKGTGAKSEIKEVKKAGWIKNKTGWWYQNSDGSYPKSSWGKINDRWYLFDDRGYMLTGWHKVKGKDYYMNASGRMQTGWTKVDDIWYYMNASGAMQTGWIKLNENWYYLNAKGEMQTRWFQTSTDGPWYYSDGGGRMQVGWVKSGGRWFYMEKNGRMATGLIHAGGNFFYLKDDGAMVENDSITLKANEKGYLE